MVNSALLSGPGSCTADLQHKTGGQRSMSLTCLARSLLHLEPSSLPTHRSKPDPR